MALSGDAFHRAVLSGTREDRRNILLQFKTHVKKDNVDLTSVPRYFEALAVTMNLLDAELQLLAFSLVCHLVKRVSIQDNSKSILPQVATVVLPMVVSRLADERSMIKVSARRALEAYWLSALEQTEAAIIDIGLLAPDPLLVNECVVWLNSLLLINGNLDLRGFFPPIASILAQNTTDQKLVSNIKILFANYFDLKHNRLYRFDLQRALESNNVAASLRSSIIGTDAVLAKDYRLRNQLTRNVPSLSASSSSSSSSVAAIVPVPRPSMPAASKQSTNKEDENYSAAPQHYLKSAPQHYSKSVPQHYSKSASQNNPAPTPQNNSDLDLLLDSLSGYKLEDTVKSLLVDNEQELLHIFASLSPFFEGKETESNWSIREKSIIKIRTLLRSDCLLKYPLTFLAAIKDISDSICKGILSLRTSLCLNSCQLIKELAFFLKSEFTPLFDLFWPTLLRLCANTKHLTSSNANVVVCTIFAKINLTPKYAQKILLAAKEKSAYLRSYAAFWLQIYMLKTYQSWDVPPNCEIVESILLKLLPDPNVQVRQAAKDAFWRYYVLAVDAATTLLSRLDSNIVKALERSRPKSCLVGGPIGPARSSRSSVKEAIMARNRDLKDRQTQSRSNSRNGFSKGNSTDSARDSLLKTTIPPAITAHTHSQSATRDDRVESYHSHLNNSHSDNKPHSSGLHDIIQANETELMPNLNKQAAGSESASTLEIEADAITDLLMDKSTKQIESGVKQLEVLFLKGLPIKDRLLASVIQTSISHPYLLRPILADASAAEKLLVCLGPNDFLRTCLVASNDKIDCVKIVTTLMDTEALFDSVILIFSWICNMDSVSDNKLLVMQLIKSKASILSKLIDILKHALLNNPIGNFYFSKILVTLLSLVPIVYQTHILESYRSLLQEFHHLDPKEFMSRLKLTSLQNQKEICNLLDLVCDPQQAIVKDAFVLNPSEPTTTAPGGGISSFLPVKNPLELAIISPEGEGTAFLPLKHPSDFTMLLPYKAEVGSTTTLSLGSSNAIGMTMGSIKAEGLRGSEISIPNQESREQIDGPQRNTETSFVQDHSSTHLSGLNHESLRREDSPSVDLSQHVSEPFFLNIFAKSDTKALKSDFVAKLNSDPPKSSSDAARDLVEDFAQVKLTTFSNSLESFIEKVDPLNRMSTRSRPIAIFEDPKGGSPQKAKDYSYTDFNWFNFLIARLSVLGGLSDEHDPLEVIYHDMQKGLLNNSQLSYLLQLLQVQGSNETNLDFGVVESSLDEFFKVTSSDKLVGLMVLKQLLVCRHPMKLRNVWNVLVSVTDSVGTDCDQQYVIELAVKEVFSEMTCGLYSSKDLFHTILCTFEHPNHFLEEVLPLIVESLLYLLQSSTLVLLMTDDLVYKLDNCLRPLMEHDSARVRKAVFKTYGLFLKTCTALGKSAETVSGDQPSAEIAMFDILQDLSVQSKSLVEYFSKDQ